MCHNTFLPLFAANSDYATVVSRGLTFTSGQSENTMSSQCTDLVIQDDTILENSENFTITLFSLSSQVNISLGRQQATVTINEDSVDSK